MTIGGLTMIKMKMMLLSSLSLKTLLFCETRHDSWRMMSVTTNEMMMMMMMEEKDQELVPLVIQK